MSIQSKSGEDRASSIQFGALILAYLGVAVCWQLTKESALMRQICSASCDVVLHSKYSHFFGIPLSRVGLCFYSWEVIYFTCGIAGIFPRPGVLVTGINLCAGLTSIVLMWLQLFVLHGFCAFCTISALVSMALCAISIAVTRSGWVKMPFTLATLSVPLLAVTVATMAIEPKPQKRILAVVGKDMITEEDAERESRLSLQPIEQAAYSVKAAWLDEKIFSLLTERQATSEKKTPAEFVRSLLKVDVKDAIVDEKLNRLTLTRDASNVEWVRSSIRKEEEKKIKSEYLQTKKDEKQFEVLYHRPLAEVTRFNARLSRRKGPANAKIELTVFSDFQCPFCSQLAPILRDISKKYPDDVSVAFRYYPIETHHRAFRAAMAVEAAAAQGKFWEYHDELFKDAFDLSDERLVRIAQGIGLDVEEFKKAINSDAAKAFVQSSYDDAVKLGVDGAPTLFLNGVMIGGVVDPATLEEYVLKVLSGIPPEQIDPFNGGTAK